MVTSSYIERGSGSDGTHGVGCRTDVPSGLGTRHPVESQHSVLVHHLSVLRELRVVRSEIKNGGLFKYLTFNKNQYVTHVECGKYKRTRMHSTRMRTARSSCCHGGVHITPPQEQAPPPSTRPPSPGSRQPPGTRPPPRGTWDQTPPIAGTPCCKACWDTTCNACWDPTPLCGQTHTFKNITFANFVCGR